MNITLQSGTVPQVNKHVAVVTVEAEGHAPAKRHTILLLDCSQSMYESIEDMRADSVNFILQLGADDYVSAIIYSGHNTAELIAGPTSCTTEGRRLLISALYAKVRVMNTTVFSEPLQKALATAQMLAQPDMGHNAVLFTDGYPVPTHWSEHDEWERARDVAQNLRDARVIVSVIGYGMHYDERFINMLMSVSGNNGTFRHISEIDNFAKTVEDIRAAFGKTVLTDAVVRITPPPKSERSILRILRATPNVVDCGKSYELHLGSLYEGKVTFFVELSQSLNQMDIGVRENPKACEEISRVKADKLTPESVQEYLNVLGAHAFLSGNRQEAAELLRLTGNDYLADRAETSYTVREQRETGDRVRRAFRDRKFIGAGLKPVGPSHCVLNVLRTLIEDPTCVVFLPKGAYKRSGILTKDPRVIESPHGRTLRVVGYVSNESRFNFSVRTLKDVKVLPEGGIGRPFDAQIYRTYNVVLDGNLHVPELEATLSESTFDLLKEAKVVKTNMRYDATRAYTLHLRDLRLISSNWANPRTFGFVHLLQEEADLEIAQTTLNAQVRTFGYQRKESEGNVYPESAQPVTDVPFEYYDAPCVEIRLMNYKPSSDVDATSLDADSAFAKVREVRQRLTTVRYLTRAITFAMETVGSMAIDWGSPKETQRGKYPKTERLARFDDATLKRVNWTERVVCS